MITNKELIKQTNAMFLGDVFIRQALDLYSEQIIKDGLADWPEHHIVHRDEWLHLAVLVRELFDKE
jgi:hypothetical protein